MSTKIKETDNNQLTAFQPDDLEQQFQKWLTEHQAAMLVYMVSPSGIPVPLPDCLDESFRKWQIGIKPIQNGKDNG